MDSDYEAIPLRELIRLNSVDEDNEDDTDLAKYPCSCKSVILGTLLFLILLFILLHTHQTRALATKSSKSSNSSSGNDTLLSELHNQPVRQKHFGRKKRSLNIHASAQNYYRFKDWILNSPRGVGAFGEGVHRKLESTQIEIVTYRPIIEDMAYILEMEPMVTENPPESTQTDNETGWPQINMASILKGASVDNELTSSNNQNSMMRGVQTGFVILDRPDPPKTAVWCSEEKEPVLTINLSNWTKPTSVSCQYGNWEGIVSDDAPKEYDVMACLDSKCQHKQYLARNCQYLPSSNQSETEQHCPVFSKISLINKVQFRFRSNHGNSTKTCVSVLRVYADDKSGIVRNETYCDVMAALFNVGTRNRRIPEYNRDCVSIYRFNCCSACPHCCLACKMEDNLNDFIVNLSATLVSISMVFVIALGAVVLMHKCYRRDKIAYIQTI